MPKGPGEMLKTAGPHGVITRSLHWLSAALIGYGDLKGLESVSQLSDPALFQVEVIYALALGVVFAIRFLWTRLFAGPTRLPVKAPAWERRASALVHTGLYVSVFGIVASGLGVALAYSAALTGGVVMAGLIGLHDVFLSMLPVLLAVQVAGAIWHELVRRDGLPESMIGRLSRAFPRPFARKDRVPL